MYIFPERQFIHSRDDLRQVVGDQLDSCWLESYSDEFLEQAVDRLRDLLHDAGFRYGDDLVDYEWSLSDIIDQN